MSEPQVIFEGDDAFCGFGGVTQGIHSAKYKGKRVAYVRRAINHDPVAIASHHANHPYVKHVVEDIRKFNPLQWSRIKPGYHHRTFFHNSLECQNFSNAKGGQTKDADSRTLAEHLPPYVEQLDTDYITIENVREFKDWGPLRVRIRKTKEGYDFCPLSKKKEGKKVIGLTYTLEPVPHRKGVYYRRWVKKIESYGYWHEVACLNSADFGAYTSRTRLFIIFAKTGLPIAWPKPTHHKTGKFGLHKWKAVRDVLDLNNEGESIFNRDKDLVENSLIRLYNGLIKHVAGGAENFMMQQYSGEPESKTYKLDRPSRALTKTGGNQYLVRTQFLSKYYGTGITSPLTDPAPSLTQKDRLSLYTIHHKQFLSLDYGNQTTGSLDDPAGAITKNPKHNLVSVNQFVNLDYSSGKTNSSLDQPADAITKHPKHKLVTVKPFIMDTAFNNIGQDIDKPLGVITADKHYHYLINPQWGLKNTSGVEQPCPTIIARQDKAPLYLICIEAGEFNIPIYDTDSETMIKIKEFMCIFGLVDIKMRMLEIVEMLLITGLPADYILKGTKTEQKKHIGNAVPPVLMKVIYEALHGANLQMLKDKLDDYEQFHLKVA